MLLILYNAFKQSLNKKSIDEAINIDLKFIKTITKSQKSWKKKLSYGRTGKCVINEYLLIFVCVCV